MVVACTYLALRGELDAVGYEQYMMPSFAFFGGILGLGVGYRIGWMAKEVDVRSLKGQLACWVCHGALTGAALVTLGAFGLRMAADGRGDLPYLLKVNSGGAIIGATVGAVVGFSLRQKLRRERAGED
jgi:hypothetical protein